MKTYFPPKHWALSEFHSGTNQKAVLLMVTAVRTSNPGIITDVYEGF
jgi:hypothetical protein